MTCSDNSGRRLGRRHIDRRLGKSGRLCGLLKRYWRRRSRRRRRYQNLRRNDRRDSRRRRRRRRRGFRGNDARICHRRVRCAWRLEQDKHGERAGSRWRRRLRLGGRDRHRLSSGGICRNFSLCCGWRLGAQHIGKARLAGLGGRCIPSRGGRIRPRSGRHEDVCRAGQRQSRPMPSAPCGREARMRRATSEPVIFTSKTPRECCIRRLTRSDFEAHLPATLIALPGRSCRALASE